MSNTARLDSCPKCGASIPAGAPQGLCPRCILIGAATATDTGIAATATSEIPSRDRIAAAFPQLEILELIGRGGMGFVFKARQPRLDRFVALKLLPDKLARDPRFAERFNREGRVLAKLNHPNIVSVFDFGSTEHFYFLIMEYVDGVNLRQAMQAGRFSPAEALVIVPKICEALQYAHGQGVLHRDIKPENILLDSRGHVKIADFGIAKLVGEETPDISLTATGAALGTPHYMAPEQFEKPFDVDHRADIYSLGVVFYEMLTGELPIGRFAAPSSKTPVGANVDEVVFRTLEKDRERRYQSAGEMKTQVEHLSEPGVSPFKGGSISPRVVEATPGAHGAPASNPPAAHHAVAPWSQKAIWGAVLVGISLCPVIALLVFVFFVRAFGNIGGGPWGLIVLVVLAALTLPAIAGTVLGWMGLSDIRAHAGQMRGYPLALFAALGWMEMILFTLALGIAVMMAYVAVGPGPMGALLMLPVCAGAITFAVWAGFAAARWGANKPAPGTRGKLRWIFCGLLVCGFGYITLVLTLRHAQRNPEAADPVQADEATVAPPRTVPQAEADTVPRP
ncbi:MAG: eukaryotic-like serine/threonine-protein kinase [Verrucomicrobiota bacterium]|jgi:tRNA A-37 threonylcarbamoyl transferase component Bud32